MTLRTHDLDAREGLGDAGLQFGNGARTHLLKATGKAQKRLINVLLCTKDMYDKIVNDEQKARDSLVHVHGCAPQGES